MAAAGLAGDSQQSANDTGAGTAKLSLTGGFDTASAFYFRGYLQADNGPILQSYLNVFRPCRVGDGAVVSPYVSLFNSTHLGDGNPMSDMSDAMLGAIVTRDTVVIDTRYAYYTTSPTMRSQVHELGAKVSFDLLACDVDSPACDSAATMTSPLSLRPSAGVYAELSDQQGTEDVYFEAGLEPSWRFELGRSRVGVGLPLVCGMSLDDYYFDNAGGHETFGYFSASVTASMSLPAPRVGGDWFLNASFQYLNLVADNLANINRGNRDESIGKLGIGFAY